MLLPRRLGASPGDPNSPLRGSNQRLGSTGDAGRRGELATVIDYQSDRYTAKVRTERGRVLEGVPLLRATPGTVAALPAGTEVLVSFDYGFPVIMGCLAMPAQRDSGGRQSYSVTDQEPDGFSQSQTEAGNFRSSSEPSDILPGDQVFVGQEGNSVGALSGGVSVLRSAPLSQVRTHAVGDLVEILSRNFRHITDMGEFIIQNEEGQVNMSFRGGTDQRAEAGSDEENWSIRMDLGSEGDLFNFELTTPQGNRLFRFHVDAEGHVELFGINGIDFQSGSRNGSGHTEDHSNSSARTVRGTRTSIVQGSETRQASSLTSTVDNDYALSVGNDLRTSVLRDTTFCVGRNLYYAVQGNNASESAVLFDVNTGDWLTDIGSPDQQGGSYLVRTIAGNIGFESTLGGNFLVTTDLGNIETSSQQVKLATSQIDSVILGGNTLASHIVKWEELTQHLGNLYSALDTHTHSINGGATAGGIFPVTGVTSIPAVPIGAPIKGEFNNFKSTKAGVSS